MSHEELIIVPVTLHPEKEDSTLAIPQESTVAPVCMMKFGDVELSFLNGVDVMRLQFGWCYYASFVKGSKFC